MHIIGLVAENFKKLRIVQITPKGRMVQVTGKNGQGKTSVLDAIWAGLEGAKAIPEKPVRKGAEKARIKLNLGEYILTRTIAPTGTHTLQLENAKGTKVGSPQAVLDDLLGTLTFDPLKFIGMKPKEQADTLREVAKVDINLEEFAALNKQDYDQRTVINRDVNRLEVEVAAITVQDGLPAEKLDERAVLDKMNAAATENLLAQQQMRSKADLRSKLLGAEQSMDNNTRALAEAQVEVKRLEQQLALARKKITELEAHALDIAKAIKAAQASYEQAPDGRIVDVGELTAELQRVQLVNREIDKRNRQRELQAQLTAKRLEAEKYTRAIEDREEKRRTALQSATMPVEGLSFDETMVTFNGIPIEQLGEAEQIRISTSIAMAANPKLRIIRITNGEALDDDSLKIIAEMAEANDFQVWMAKVDSSGKVGIVMEDGMVKSENEDVG